MNSAHEIVFKEKWNCLVNKKKKKKKGLYVAKFWVLNHELGQGNIIY